MFFVSDIIVYRITYITYLCNWTNQEWKQEDVFIVICYLETIQNISHDNWFAQVLKLDEQKHLLSDHWYYCKIVVQIIMKYTL